MLLSLVQNSGYFVTVSETIRRIQKLGQECVPRHLPSLCSNLRDSLIFLLTGHDTRVLDVCNIFFFAVVSKN
jgi:hypothetical protein